jgi:hypothetical protein
VAEVAVHVAAGFADMDVGEVMQAMAVRRWLRVRPMSNGAGAGSRR